MIAQKFHFLKKSIFYAYNTEDSKVHYEAFEGQILKWTTSGELTIGLESHQGSKFWSNEQIFCDRN